MTQFRKKIFAYEKSMYKVSISYRGGEGDSAVSVLKLPFRTICGSPPSFPRHWVNNEKFQFKGRLSQNWIS